MRVRVLTEKYLFFRFDKHLLKAWQLKHNTEAWKTFLSYMQGQLYFHMATVIFKRAKQVSVKYENVTVINGMDRTWYICEVLSKL